MRHRVAGRHLSRTSAHSKALRRNLAQSLFQHGQIQTTLVKAKEVRPFVERLITLARRNTLASRQRLESLLTDRAAISKDDQEKYDAMSDAQRAKVLKARSGRRHRTGKVPASYNKKKIPFVATSIIHKLVNEVAPKFAGRPGGYTRIIRLPKSRIGDGGDLAILQLVGGEEAPGKVRKTTGQRRRKAADRTRYLEGRAAPKKRVRPTKAAPAAAESSSGEAGSPA